LQADYAGKPCPFWFFGLALPYSGVVACRRSQLKIAATPGKIEPSLCSALGSGTAVVDFAE
jgi:hypothetical protein